MNILEKLPGIQLYDDTKDDDKIALIIILEQLLKSLAGLLFLIMAAIRFCKIRPIGFSKTTVYSKLFLAKVYCQYV